MTTVYLSGPISDMSYEGASDWRNACAVVLNQFGFRVLDPMRGKSFLSNQTAIRREVYEGLGRPDLSDEALVARDTADVVASDIVLVNLLPGHDRVSQGTLHELSLARYLHKIVVVVIDEGNIHNHPFNRVGVITFNDMAQAMEYIISCRVPDPSPRGLGPVYDTTINGVPLDNNGIPLAEHTSAEVQ